MPDGLNGARIAVTCSGLDHVRRGVETWSQQAFLGLQRQGTNVTLFKGSGENGAPETRVVRCLQRGSRTSTWLTRALVRGGWRIGLGSSYQAEQTTFALNLWAAVRRDFDILHTKDPQVALIFHRLHRMGLSRPKVILNHGTEEPPAFLNRFDYIQHLAPFHLDEAIRQGVRARRHFAIPNFVDTETFQPASGLAVRQMLGIPADAFVVLSVAAVKRHHKRLDWLVQETARLRGAGGRETYLVIVGSRTEDTGPVIALAKSNLGDRVRFLIDRPHAGMPEVYRVADVLALCSLKEMLANVYLEAMASGVPCIGSRFPVTEWVIGDGGETIDMERPGALAAALRRFQDPAYQRAVGARARTHAVAHFSSESVLVQQQEMYHAVLEDRR